MARLAFCADEHVPNAFTTALESNGFTVVQAERERGERTVDDRLLTWCGTKGYVLLTNDRDFVRFVETGDHAGVIIYPTQELPASAFPRGIRRVDRQCTPSDVAGTLV